MIFGNTAILTREILYWIWYTGIIDWNRIRILTGVGSRCYRSPLFGCVALRCVVVVLLPAARQTDRQILIIHFGKGVWSYKIIRACAMSLRDVRSRERFPSLLTKMDRHNSTKSTMHNDTIKASNLTQWYCKVRLLHFEYNKESLSVSQLKSVSQLQLVSQTHNAALHATELNSLRVRVSRVT